MTATVYAPVTAPQRSIVSPKTKGMRHATIRAATVVDAARLHQLIADHLAEGRLLPRGLPDLEAHATRFFVATAGEAIVGCAELAPLGRSVAEVRSLAVEASHRGVGVGAALIGAVIAKARAGYFARLSAFTHEPAPFVRRGFSIVPRLWVPQKIATDCVTCDRLRHCEQRALLLDLRSAGTSPEAPPQVA
ncbi:MAG: GNAT family N-acetyltransferase [Vicinamibacterales bacterium]|nr:GNAT family N-acetyltransferase [Acidobacteriota bacterium]MDP7472358.1 GNAT family N-acetyltransferase [Vicinamibacterales bacterium]MDP7670723.1 GNAT family N-acetyltransferase [Vicinamibacterales bacterium]HJO38994.1 GNAT family N-acetyltransferase [Vicinamibacterales bacterium]